MHVITLIVGGQLGPEERGLLMRHDAFIVSLEGLTLIEVACLSECPPRSYEAVISFPDEETYYLAYQFNHDASANRLRLRRQ